MHDTLPNRQDYASVFKLSLALKTGSLSSLRLGDEEMAFCACRL